MGVIFWIVIKSNAWGHNIPSRVGGNQKWNGAEPAFKSKAVDKGAEKSIFIVIITAEIRRIVDPSAWIKKYFKAASDEYWLFLIKISGIKDNKFNSSPIQAPNHELEEIEIIIPSVKVIIKKTCDGENTIKKRKIRPS